MSIAVPSLKRWMACCIVQTAGELSETKNTWSDDGRYDMREPYNDLSLYFTIRPRISENLKSSSLPTSIILTRLFLAPTFTKLITTVLHCTEKRPPDKKPPDKRPPKMPTRTKDHSDKRPPGQKATIVESLTKFIMNFLRPKMEKSSSNISISTNRHVCCWV